MKKYTIIGQGLAGSILAYMLMQEGQEVQIIDSETIPSSSKVAAGLYNPVTGRKLVKTWLADDIFPFLEDFYPKLEKELNAKFFHPIPIYRPFVNEDSQKYFKSDHVPDDFSDFATLEFENINHQNIVNSQLGGVTTKHSGWVDLKAMLEAFRGYFLSKGILQGTEPQGRYDTKMSWEIALRHSDLAVEKIIYCEGFNAINNPYFSYLPFSPVKGELLDVEIQNTDIQEVINQGAFVIPLGGNTYRLGATYSWHELDFLPTEQGKADLVEKYQKLMKPKMKILSHRAGVRPATKDRRPFIGMHPELENIGIFNGLGSKGVSLAPFFAKQFVDFLVNDKELYPEVNINRFASLYLGCK
ncbi:MAG: FAD-binding oxidoreductase [Arcicella sp.]|nr:FAD-binding oxidoreductase [Arcicella sp.]